MLLMSFAQRSFDLGGVNGFGREGGGGTGYSLSSKCVKKILISRQKVADFSTLDLSQTF